jgi:NADPH2:quinone reductase
MFRNIRIDFLGSDDVAAEDKVNAAHAVNDALLAGWRGFEIAERFPLEEIATAHERAEAPLRRGRLVLTV